MKAIATVLVLAAGAASAQDCPTAADLDGGIRFAVDKGDTETFTHSGRPGIVTSIFEDAEGGQTQNLLAQGIYLLESRGLSKDDDWRSAYAFEMNADRMPLPAPGESVEFDTVSNVAWDLSQERQSYRFGEMAQARYGDCTYDMIPIEVRYEPGEATDLEVLHYLPGLGVALFVESRYNGGTDVFDYTSVEKVE